MNIGKLVVFIIVLALLWCSIMYGIFYFILQSHYADWTSTERFFLVIFDIVGVVGIAMILPSYVDITKQRKLSDEDMKGVLSPK